MNTIYILLAALAVMLVSLVGIFTTIKVFRGWAENNLKYLATFATGVFIVVAYNLVNETFYSHLSPGAIAIIIAIGGIIAFAIDKAIPDAHHHHDSTENPVAHSKAGAQRIVLSDSLHNITDGFLIVPAFLVDIRLGLLTTAGIMIHEVAQEISEFFVLRSAGYSIKKTLLINFVTSSTILVGAIIALFITNVSEDLVSILLAIAAGIIIYTIIKDLIPYSIAVAKKENTYAKHVVAALAGIAIISVLGIATADTHVHPSEDSDEHGHNESEHDEHHDEMMDAHSGEKDTLH